MSDHFHVYENVRDHHKMINSRSHFHFIELEINSSSFLWT